MLTDRQIKTATPGAKARRLWDGGGLYLEVSPIGSKLWRWKFRWAGKEKRLAIGVYPDVSLAEARKLAADARKLLRRGTDPALVKAKEKAKASGAESFEFIARKWHTTASATLEESHSGRVLRRLEADVFPYMGARALDDIKTAEWLAVLRRIEARGAIETAHRTRATVAQVYRFARASGLATTDPLLDLRGALQPAPTKHLASKTEPEELRPILLAIDGYRGTYVVKVALLLAPLLFARPGELRSMKWADVDLDRGDWRFLASKTGTPHIVPLSRQALALLVGINPLTGDGVHVFPSLRGDEKSISDNTLNAALRGLGIDTRTEMTTHGWRAAARTMLEERLGFRPEVIELQLAHAVRDPLGRAYNRTTHLEERKRMMQAWADFLDGLRVVDGGAK